METEEKIERGYEEAVELLRACSTAGAIIGQRVFRIDSHDR
jgi:hypothetical protein